MKTIVKRKISLIVILLQLVVSVLFCIYVGTLGAIPMKYLVALVIVAVLLLVYQIMSQATDSSYIFGRVLALVFGMVFFVGAKYMNESMAALQDVGGATMKVDIISFYVLNDDPAKTIADAKDYTYGILSMQDRENTDKALAEAKSKAGKDLKIMEFDDSLTLVDALYAKEIQVAVINQSFLNPIKDKYVSFTKDTRELENSEIQTEVEEEIIDTDVTTKPFNVYISGIDVYGKIGQTSRSDVNIIATVNPVTKKILLTSTPRDFYVPLYTNGGK